MNHTINKFIILQIKLEVAVLHIDPKMSFSDINHLVYAIELRDAYTQGHSERVAKYSYILSATLGLSIEDCTQIYVASLLHDVGKIGIPDAVLLKPGKLEDSEYELIQQHGTLSGKILEKMENFKYLAPMVRHHHEDFNGGGYPDGLQGKAIPLGARIISIADVFDALTTRRIYRGAMPLEKAISIMDSMQENLKFDPDLYDTFIEIVKKEGILEENEVGISQNIELSELDIMRNNFFFSDTLTKLLNRDALIALLRKCADYSYTVICGKLNIKDFRSYNKLYGTIKGDELLKSYANMLKDGLKGNTNITEPKNNDLYLFRLHADIFIFLYIGQKMDYIEFRLSKVLDQIDKALGIEIEYSPILKNEKVPKNIEKKIGHML